MDSQAYVADKSRFLAHCIEFILQIFCLLLPFMEGHSIRKPKM